MGTLKPAKTIKIIMTLYHQIVQLFAYIGPLKSTNHKNHYCISPNCATGENHKAIYDKQLRTYTGYS